MFANRESRYPTNIQLELSSSLRNGSGPWEPVKSDPIQTMSWSEPVWTERRDNKRAPEPAVSSSIMADSGIAILLQQTRTWWTVTLNEFM
jgi:hypothetical protein